MIILGIETSCDETAISIIETRDKAGTHEYRVLSSLIHSQAELHSAYGGVYPSLAKREHSKNLIPLLEKALGEAVRLKDNASTDAPGIDTPINTIIDNDTWNAYIRKFEQDVSPQNPDLFESFKSADFIKERPSIDLIAVTEGPGLEPALWTGITFAKMLSKVWNVPTLPINHMEGHIIGSLFQSNLTKGEWIKMLPVQFPAIALLISGGHTEFVDVKVSSSQSQNFSYALLGQTRDDAVGEAFDKVARLLDLPYPGGPHISKLAKEAREKNIPSPFVLPRPMQKSGNLEMSFSGLKTSVLYSVKKLIEKNKIENGSEELTNTQKIGIAREFEDAIADTLLSKLKYAIENTNNNLQYKSLIIGGGVIANSYLRVKFESFTKERGISLFLPSKEVTGDNALMIALTAGVNGSSDASIIKSSQDIRAQGTKRLI